MRLLDFRRRSRWFAPASVFASLFTMLSIAAPVKAQQGGSVEAIADTDIVLAIRNELRGDDGVAAHLIDVASVDGVVTLSGSVDNLLARRRAAELAMGIKGVQSVANTIEVMPSERSSTQLRADVVRALLVDPATESYEVSVTATVDHWGERKAAEDNAFDGGAWKVRNKLKVRHWPPFVQR